MKKLRKISQWFDLWLILERKATTERDRFVLKVGINVYEVYYKITFGQLRITDVRMSMCCGNPFITLTGSKSLMARYKKALLERTVL